MPLGSYFHFVRGSNKIRYVYICHWNPWLKSLMDFFKSIKIGLRECSVNVSIHLLVLMCTIGLSFSLSPKYVLKGQGQSIGPRGSSGVNGGPVG